MIKYNNKNINAWNYDLSSMVKVYHNGALCFYKIVVGEKQQIPCFAVVDSISTYTDREFPKVFESSSGEWYFLNNINQYEVYGEYGSGRTITTYEGKLTIDDGFEYEWDGTQWVNLGAVSGGTLPNVPFTVNYNAKNYNASTQTFLKTDGQLANTDVRVSGGTLTHNDGYVTVQSGSRGVISGYGTYFKRNNSNPNITIISKQRTSGSDCHLFANRNTSNYNWMYRPYDTKLTLHGTSEQGSVVVTQQPVIEAVRINSNRLATYNNYTDNTSSTYTSFSYGSTNEDVALFASYTNYTGEWFVGDFYWIYMSQSTLTDEQVRQVIEYNEGSGEEEYPMYYDELQDPPNNLVFETMQDALDYECPWVGMLATIGGDSYIFSYNSETDKYSWEEYTPPAYDGLTFVALEDETFKFSGTSASNTLSYSLDGGSTWTPLANNTNTPTVASGSSIMFKGECVPNGSGIGKFVSSGRFNVEGNAMSLLYGDNFDGQTSLSGKDYAFKNLFSGNTNVVSAENLELPSTTLALQCYYQMFRGCTSLTTAPTLGATTLAERCYQYMFRDCSSLTVAPELPNTTLTSYCYNGMFYGCTSLTTAPTLSATTLANYCYAYMFRGCTSLTTAPTLSAKTLAGACYNGMFYGCTSLTTAPELPATTLENTCYYGMFANCTSLNSITCLATDISASSCTTNWVQGVASSGTFTKAASMTSWTSGANGIPTNWTVLNDNS